MMKYFPLIPKVVFFLMLFNCTGAKYLEQTNLGETAFQEKEYQKALEIAEISIGGLPQKQKPEHGQVYALAGNSAFALEQYDKSLDYLEKARQLKYVDELMYLNLAAGYNRVDNLSREIGILEEHIQVMPEGEHIAGVRERLFQTCQESMNYDQALELWPLLDDQARSRLINMEVFLAVNSELENDSTCMVLASGILEQYGDNETALKYLGEKYFWKAEKSYLAEMQAYKENRTQKQYAILLKAFKIVNSDFRKSLDYFTRLYKLNPAPEYAQYLGNIYTRLDDEQKARYYLDKAK